MSYLAYRLEEIFSKVSIQDRGYETECWIYTGKLDVEGYPQISYSFKLDKEYKRQQVIYILLVGEIEKGKAIDHLCYVRSCLNPTHLEQVDHLENRHRGLDRYFRNNVRTHCSKGHELTEKNKQKNGKCKICVKEYNKQMYQKLKKERINYV